MNQLDVVTQGTFLRAKQAVTVAIDFLNWLADHDVELAELEQGHRDAWQASGPSTRLVVDRFLTWAVKARLVRADLKVARHRRGTSPRMNAEDQQRTVQRVVHSDELNPRDRAVAILVVVFGQQIEDVVALTWDDVAVADATVTVRVGTIRITMPEPLDLPWRELATKPGNDDRDTPQQRLGFSGLLSRSPHRRRAPASPAARRVQHSRRAAGNTARTHENHARRHPRRGPRLPPGNHRAAHHRLGCRLQPIRRRQPWKQGETPVT